MEEFDFILLDIDTVYNKYELEHNKYMLYLRNSQIVSYIPKDYIILIYLQCFSILLNYFLKILKVYSLYITIKCQLNLQPLQKNLLQSKKRKLLQKLLQK